MRHHGVLALDFGLPDVKLSVMTDFAFDHTALAFGSLADEPDDLSFWLAQTPETRLAGIEFLRRQFYSYGSARPELRRFLEIVERSRS